MSKYMTKQRKILLEFLSEHADEQLTAKLIAENLEKNGISVSAVYRNISELEKDGKVRRISKSGSREVYYQYSDGVHCRNCLHLSCEKCGKTYHMNIEGAEMLVDNLAQTDNFVIDKANTVLYGVCGECQSQH